MRIIIFGAGKAGKFLYDEIEKNAKDIQVLSFVDNFLVGQYRGITIQNPVDFFSNNLEKIDAVFISAGAQKTLKLMVNIVISYGIRNIYMLHDIAGKCKISPFMENGDIMSRYLRKINFSAEKPTLPYYEVPVTDKCNLNCKGCLFACNGIQNNEHISYEQIEKDAYRMSELFYDIPWIRILGGEPLMHPEIIQILTMYRKVFPGSEIDLCTNGLLLPKMNKEFFDCLKQNEISVHVSGYKPTYHLLDKIDNILKQHGLNYTVLKREMFAKYYTTEPTNNRNDSYIKCIASECHEVYNGRFLKCSAIIAFDKFNEQFGTNYVTKENDDWFDIHRNDINAWDIVNSLNKSSSACAYCDVRNMVEFEWDYSGQEVSISDYVL